MPYPTHSLRQAQPDRLATIATLFGMEPPPVERCRVLELGCGEGANATAMAFHAPGSEIVGIDISTAAIARARVAAEALGLSNVTFRHVDIMDLSLEAAPFDYIIAHGVYSWVEAPVRDRLLAICRALLGPHGVAFVSYNTLPGYHVAGMLREMMLFHVRGTEDPRKPLQLLAVLLGTQIRRHLGPGGIRARSGWGISRGRDRGRDGPGSCAPARPRLRAPARSPRPDPPR